MMDDTATTPMSPLIFSNIQGAYVDQLTLAFNWISHYAIQLFYVLAALELAFFGIMWALKQNEMMAGLLVKIIKLGFIFFLISNYNYILESLLNGFTLVSLHDVGNTTAKYIFNPDLLWQFGFDSSISLLQLAVQYGTTNIGMTSIYLILGFGILFLFALIATQVLILTISFYILSLLALLLLPFGTFTVTQDLCYQSLRGVIQAATRIFAFILVLGIGIGIWASMNIQAFSQTTTIDQPLGLLFATFVITILCYIIPSYAGRAIGHFGESFWDKEGAAPAINVTTTSTVAQASPVINVAAATNIAGQMSTATQAGATISAMGQATTVSAAGASAGGASRNFNQGISELTKAVRLQRQEGISRETLNKLKNSFKEVLNQQNKS